MLLERVRVVLIVTSGTKMGAQIAKDIVRPSLSLTTIIILLVAITTSVILCHFYFINMFNMFILFLDHPSHVSRKTIIIMSCQERSHPQHDCHPSGGVFQLCPQGMINLVWFSRPGNCVFLFFFLVLLNDPSKSFHHPCFYYNL